MNLTPATEKWQGLTFIQSMEIKDEGCSVLNTMLTADQRHEVASEIAESMRGMTIFEWSDYMNKLIHPTYKQLNTSNMDEKLKNEIPMIDSWMINFCNLKSDIEMHTSRLINKTTESFGAEKLELPPPAPPMSSDNPSKAEKMQYALSDLIRITEILRIAVDRIERFV